MNRWLAVLALPVVACTTEFPCAEIGGELDETGQCVFLEPDAGSDAGDVPTDAGDVPTDAGNTDASDADAGDVLDDAGDADAAL